MSHGAYTLKRHDTDPPMTATLRDERGPAPLMGAQVTFLMAQQGGPKVVSGEAEIVSAENGRVQYVWKPGDTDTAGIYRAEFEVVYAPGLPEERRETFPSNDYTDVIILADLG